MEYKFCIYVKESSQRGIFKIIFEFVKIWAKMNGSKKNITIYQTASLDEINV